MPHIYNLRKSGTYRKRRIVYQSTRPVSVSIGERRKPDPQGRPGYLRIDTVHQGDRDGIKGVYHVNAVDEVTQWQVVGTTAQIRERAKQIGARLDFWSEAGAGTEVELTVPASVAYARSRDAGGFRLLLKKTGTHAH